VTDLKVEGQKFSFVGTGRTGWASNGVPHCCPRLTFEGTVDADTLSLTMIWTSSERPDDPAVPILPMQATRTP
jgi:hypothetical protein